MEETAPCPRLTLVPDDAIGDGREPGTEPTQFEVIGLPEGQCALICATCGQRWQILRGEPGTPRVWGSWEGDYATAEEALAALQATLTHRADR